MKDFGSARVVFDNNLIAKFPMIRPKKKKFVSGNMPKKNRVGR
jgi:hypothetical protein